MLHPDITPGPIAAHHPYWGADKIQRTEKVHGVLSRSTHELPKTLNIYPIHQLLR